MKYIQYCRNLQFEEKPDYNYVRSLFKNLMARMKFEYDGQYDWVLKKEGKDDQLRTLLQKDDPSKSTHVPRTLIVEEHKDGIRQQQPA